MSRSLRVHHLVEGLTNGWEHLIPGTGLPIIERASWRDPGWKGNLDTIGQGAHKRLVCLTQLGQLLLEGCSFLQVAARCRQHVLQPSKFGQRQPVHSLYG